MIVADASFLIGLADAEDVHHRAAVQLRAGLRGRTVLLHPLTLAECLVGPARLDELQSAETSLRTATVVVEFDPTSPARFALLRAQARLRLPDAIVLDTAIVHGAGIATFDERLAASARTRGLEVLGTA